MINFTDKEKVIYDKLIEDAEREIFVIRIREMFWQRKEIEAKSGKEGIMKMLRDQAAQMIVQTEWLTFLKEKAGKK